MGETQVGQIDTSAIITAMGGIRDSIQTFIGEALPILVAIGTAALVFFLGRFVFRLVKSWLSAGK